MAVLVLICVTGCDADWIGTSAAEQALGETRSVAGSPVALAATDIVIGQFNMAGGNDGETGDLKGTEAPDALLASIRDRHPSFIAIQEACQDWSDYMAIQLPDYTVKFEPIIGGDGKITHCKHDLGTDTDPGTPFGLAVLYRNDLGIDTDKVAYPLGTPRGEQRKMLCSESQARRLVVCSVHLTAGDDDMQRDARRIESTRAREILATRYAGYTIFVGGDLNDGPLSEAADNFYDTGYGFGAQGSLKEVDSPCGNDIRQFLSILFPQFVCRDGETTHGNFLTRVKFDYLFVSPSVFVKDADATSAIHSDHDPLWATVTLDDSGGGGDGGGEGTDLVPFVEAGGRVAGLEGDGVVLGGSAFDLDGTVSVTWSYRPLGDVDAGTVCTFDPPDQPQTTFRCTDDGTFEVTLTGSDGVNAPVSDSTIAFIRNAPPKLTVTGPAPWAVFRAGQSVALSAGFTDGGANDPHTCTIDWDDGAIDSTAAAASCNTGHVFAHAGMYTVATSVTDDDGGSDSDRRLVIVYDPDAGFVTGAGQADSPAGSLAAEPELAGTAHFELNPKYLPQDAGPAPGNGKLDFALQTATFDLRSTALDWLVVTPSGRTAIKGRARLGDDTGLGFVAYATAAPDGWRLVAWRLADGDHPADATVYDNLRGADYDLDRFAAPGIVSGAIQVHQP